MLLLPTLLLALSEARAGGAPAPDIDGQRGFGPPVVAADSAHVAVTRWDRAGLWVWTPATGAVTTVTEARGAGFAPVWDDDALLFKTVSGTDSLTEQAVRWSGGITEVLDEAPILGQPTPLGAGHALWARRDAFRRSEPAGAMTEHPVPGLGEVDLVVAHGETVAWDDDAGRLLIRDLPTGATRVLTAASPGSHPAWSDDGALLLHRTHQGDIEVLDVATGAVTARVQGMDPAWVPGTHDIVYARIETAGPGAGSPYTVVSDSLWTFSGDSGAQTPLFEDTTLHARHPTPIGDDLLFVDARGGDLYRWHAGTVTRVLVAPSTSPAAPPPDTTRTEVIVPYLHQLWDTPDDFDGNWSCGPTSCVQTLSRWSVLPNADITCSWPSPHTSHWGWYIPNNYNYAGYQYDIWGIDPQGSCQGAHGFICRSYGGAIWADMTLYMQQHGVDSAAVGTNYDSLINETSAGYPVYASVNVLGYGHILVMRGFLSENGSPIHSMIINDPYGNAGSGDWGNDDGEDIVYDWPGYNNGHLEIDVAQLFTAHGPTARLDTGSSTPVDTGNGGSGGSSGDGSGGSSTGDTDTAATDSPPVRDTGPIVSGPLPGEPTTMLPDSGCSTGAPVRPLPLATALGALALVSTISRRRRGPPRR